MVSFEDQDTCREVLRMDRRALTRSAICEDREFIFASKVDIGIQPISYNDWTPASLEKYRHLKGGKTALLIFGDSSDKGEYDVRTWRDIKEKHG